MLPSTLGELPRGGLSEPEKQAQQVAKFNIREVERFLTVPVSAGHVQQHVQQQHSVLAQPSLHKSLTEQSRLLFNMHLTVLPETEYTRELI